MANWGGAAGGALSGAAAGSSFGPWGAAAGGVIGGISGLFGGKKKKRKRISTLDPQQQSLYDDYVQSIRGDGPLGGLYDYDAEGSNRNFDKNVARPAYRGFEENIIPQITGQFRGNNIGNSSYTGEALGRAGRNVQENLDALRSNTQFQGQQNAQQNKQGAIQNILGMHTFDWQEPGESSLDKILGSVGPAAGKYAADYFGGQGGGGTSSPTKPSGDFGSFSSLIGQGNSGPMVNSKFSRV